MLPLRVISPFCFHWLPYKYNWPPFSNFLAPNNFSGCEEKSAVRPNPIANVKGTSEEPQRVNYTVGMELNQTSLLYCWNPKYAYVGGTHWLSEHSLCKCRRLSFDTTFSTADGNLSHLRTSGSPQKEQLPQSIVFDCMKILHHFETNNHRLVLMVFSLPATSFPFPLFFSVTHSLCLSRFVFPAGPCGLALKANEM